jgi:hypothetical protein
MKKKDIRRAAEAKVALGYSRQHAFDEMRLEHPELDVLRLAEAVRYVPSLAARQRYRVEQGALLAAIAASAFLQFIHAPGIYGAQAVDARAFLFAIPVATVALGVGIGRYHAKLYRWLALLSLYGIFRRMGVVRYEELDVWPMAFYALSAVTAGLAFYLHMKLATNYTVMPATEPPVVEFPPEPGAMAM